MAQMYQNSEEVISKLSNQNAGLQKQTNVLNSKLLELKSKLNKRSHLPTKKPGKKCDHAFLINQLETQLKSTENAYKTSQTELGAQLKELEAQLAKKVSAKKTVMA